MGCIGAANSTAVVVTVEDNLASGHIPLNDRMAIGYAVCSITTQTLTYLPITIPECEMVAGGFVAITRFA